MLFPTLEFALFFAVVLPLGWLLSRRPTAWKVLMLGASWFFYGWWDLHFVGLLAALSLLNLAFAHLRALAASASARRRLLVLALVVDLGVLVFFKYWSFLTLAVVGTVAAIGGAADAIPMLEILLPVGVSFFTFQAISYVVDVYRRQVPPAPLLDFAVYLALFPQLIAGPIVRAAELLPQLAAPRDPARIDVGRAWRLIAGGMLKKVVLAEHLGAGLVDPVFASPGAYSAPTVWLAVYGYAAQIYCDFSAYSDIAIGIALLLGLRFPDNFRAPYTATSLQDFWRRWHMTLSRWLRDYLYIPLGGGRHGPLQTARNLALTMLLGGLWHGAAWRFLLWGALHGGYLVLERTLGLGRAPASAGRRALRRVWIFHLVCFGWIFFRAPSLERAGAVLAGLVRPDWSPPALPLAVLLALGVGLGAQGIPARWLERAEEGFARLSPLAQGAVVAVTLAGISALSPPGVPAFIYFQF